MDSIGDRLRIERKRLALTQQEMADIGGVKTNAQGNYENNSRMPKADYLASLCRNGVDIVFVLIGERMAD